MPHIHCYVDTLCRTFVEGWALSRSGKCTIEVVVDGRVVGNARTGLLRADVTAVDVVEFHKGFFSDTVPAWPSRPVMCMWMDVDLEQSAVDALKVFPNLERRGVLFSHECAASTFRERSPVPVRGPDDVVGPIVDAFAAENRRPAGVFLLGHTGAFWEAGQGIPVLPHAAFERLVALARQ